MPSCPLAQRLGWNSLKVCSPACFIWGRFVNGSARAGAVCACLAQLDRATKDFLSRLRSVLGCPCCRFCGKPP